MLVKSVQKQISYYLDNVDGFKWNLLLFGRIGVRMKRLACIGLLGLDDGVTTAMLFVLTIGGGKLQRKNRNEMLKSR